MEQADECQRGRSISLSRGRQHPIEAMHKWDPTKKVMGSGTGLMHQGALGPIKLVTRVIALMSDQQGLYNQSA